MAWETRARGGLYYTRSRREGGRVIREYVGAVSGALVADRDASRRAEAHAARQAKQQARTEDAALLGQTRAFCEGVEAVLRDTLSAAGYHRHERGAWRKRRGLKPTGTTGENIMPNKPAPDKNEISHLQMPGPKQPAVPTTRSTFDVLKGAQNGDESTRKELRAFLEDRQKKYPAGMRALPTIAMSEIVGKIAGKNILLEEDLMLQLGYLLEHIGGPAPSFLEELLVDRIIICWLWVNYFDAMYAGNIIELSITSSEFHLRRLDGAQRRYLAAVKALAQVRRLQLPTVQLNVGQNQINVGERQVNQTKG